MYVSKKLCAIGIKQKGSYYSNKDEFRRAATN